MVAVVKGRIAVAHKFAIVHQVIGNMCEERRLVPQVERKQGIWELAEHVFAGKCDIADAHRPVANAFVNRQPEFVIVEITARNAFESVRIAQRYFRPFCGTQAKPLIVVDDEEFVAGEARLNDHLGVLISGQRIVLAAWQYIAKVEGWPEGAVAERGALRKSPQQLSLKVVTIFVEVIRPPNGPKTLRRQKQVVVGKVFIVDAHATEVAACT